MDLKCFSWMHLCHDMANHNGKLFILCLSRTKHPYILFIWVIMCRKNSDQIHVIFSQSLWLQCALLCLPGNLQLGCSWTAHKCKSPQVINLAKSKYFNISGNYFGETLNCHILSTKIDRPEYQLSPGTKYINVIQCDSHKYYLDMHTTQSILNNPSGPQSNAIKYKVMTWIWSLFCLQMSSHMVILGFTWYLVCNSSTHIIDVTGYWQLQFIFQGCNWDFSPFNFKNFYQAFWRFNLS